MAEHHFDVDDAIKHGIESAILLSNIRFWLAHNKANGKHIHDGYIWTYNSASAYKELFPYMGQRTISRRIEKLSKAGVIKTGNYNKRKGDKTFWYTIPAEFAIDSSDLTKQQDEFFTKSQAKPKAKRNQPTKRNAKSPKQPKFDDLSPKQQEIYPYAIKTPFWASKGIEDSIATYLKHFPTIEAQYNDGTLEGLKAANRKPQTPSHNQPDNGYKVPKAKIL